MPAAAALAIPAAAWASPDAVVRDCAADGSLDGDYSDADKRAALGQLGAELEEYSDCRSVIAASIGRRAGARSSSRQAGNGAASGGSSRTSASSQDGNAATRPSSSKKKRTRVAAGRGNVSDKARERRATEVALGAGAIDRGESGAHTSADTANGTTTPLLLALIALGLTGAAGAMFALSKHSPRVAEALRRVSFGRFRR